MDIIVLSVWKKKENIAVKQKNFVRKTEFVRSAIKKSCMETRNNAYYAESITGVWHKKSTNRSAERKVQKPGFRETQKKLYAERVSNGICTRCGKLKVVPGRKKCGICLEKDMILHRNRRAYEVELQQTK